MSKNTVTVVIPTFNRRGRLEIALNSVLQENRVDIEVHIFDNASTDDTEVFVRELSIRDPRVKYFRNDTNIGAVLNYKKSFESIKSEYFIPLADDDWIIADFIFDAYHIMQNDEKLGAAVFLTEQRDESGNVQATYPTLPEAGFGRREPAAHVRSWMASGHYAWSSILWRTDVLEVGGLPDPEAGLAADVDFQIQVFCKYPVHLINKLGAVYLYHTEQNSQNFDVRSIPYWSTIFKKLDRAVSKTQLIPVGEYTSLRETMLQRYRGIWQTAAKAALCDDDIKRLAVQAAFILGDWDFTLSLTSQMTGTSIRLLDMHDFRPHMFVPEYVVSDGEPGRVGTKIQPRSFFSIVILFGSIRDKFDILSKKIETLERRLVESEQRADTYASTGALAQNVSRETAALHLALSQKDSQIRELQQSRWRRIGRRLGLARKASFET